MNNIINAGQPVTLSGKSGTQYDGIIYDKEGQSTFTGRAIVCLTNSVFSDHRWAHAVNSIYRTEKVENAMEEYKERDDVSHIVIVPQSHYETGKRDNVDDLIRRYLHG